MGLLRGRQAEVTANCPEDRFRALFDANHRAVLAYSLRRTTSPADAADLLADTMLVAWRRIDDVPTGEAARPWLYGIARNVLANHRRGTRRRQRLGERLAAGIDAAVSDASGPLADRLWVTDALATLGDVDREVLTLTLWEGLSPGEIAAVIAAAAIDDDQVTSLPLGALVSELRELIMATNDRTGRIENLINPMYPTRLRRLSRTRRVRRLAVAVVAGVAVSAGVITANLDRDATSAYADEVVAVAEAAPRMLVTAGGWSVVRADEYSSEDGEMTFSNGEHEVDLSWRPAGTHDDYVSDRAHSADSLTDIKVAGNTAQLFRYTGTNDYTALWLDGKHSLELRGVFDSETDYRSLVATIKTVDVETWLDAMPRSVVRPGDRTTAIAELRAGIPLPVGFDKSAWNGTLAADRYQLGALIAGAVACAWLDQWVAADAIGNTAVKTEAAAALAGAKNWPILLEMDREGDYPEAIWELADAVAHDGINPAYGTDQIRTGAYRSLLGCDIRH